MMGRFLGLMLLSAFFPTALVIQISGSKILGIIDVRSLGMTILHTSVATQITTTIASERRLGHNSTSTYPLLQDSRRRQRISNFFSANLPRYLFRTKLRLRVAKNHT